MTRVDLQAISRMRQREAKVLLTARHFPGAYYLIGYSVECALKAAIARQTNRYDFPDKNFAAQAFSHELTALLKLAGLKDALEASSSASPVLARKWAIVKDWSVESRYRSVVPPQTALDMYSASTSRNGVLSWIRERW